MDPELVALASASGMAVAQAAGTDAWQSIRAQVVRLFGRGSTPEGTQRAVLDNLDRTAADLSDTDPDAVARIREAADWRTRILALLENLNALDREQALVQLRELAARGQPHQSGVAASDNSVAFGGSAHISAQNQAAAAVAMGDVTIGNPPQPGPDQS
ncbi:hypothetical protein ACYF6T_42435 [Streptomyces sp. 7R007]